MQKFRIEMNLEGQVSLNKQRGSERVGKLTSNVFSEFTVIRL